VGPPCSVIQIEEKCRTLCGGSVERGLKSAVTSWWLVFLRVSVLPLRVVQCVVALFTVRLHGPFYHVTSFYCITQCALVPLKAHYRVTILYYAVCCGPT
jgi:hypothetical protein